MLRLSRSAPLRLAPLTRALDRFKSDETGAFIVWSLFTVIMILMAVGVGISAQLFEIHRTRMQNTLDSAVLAATALDQTLEPQEVVEDYLARAGMGEALGRTRISKGVNYRTIYASADLQMPTFFVVGDGEWEVISRAEANETRNDIEIALVLDNSGSMGWSNNYRLNLLKPAAQNFVDQVARSPNSSEPGSVVISVVPFATQVTTGPVLGGELNFTDQHDITHCGRFDDADYRDLSIDPDEEIERAGHFEISTWGRSSPSGAPDLRYIVCQGYVGDGVDQSSRHILPWAHEADDINDYIDSMYATGNTSIDVATKWASALLDPEFRPVVTSLISDGEVHSEASGQPFSYTRENTVKVLVVMSDGQNTDEFRLDDEYLSGDSPLYRSPRGNDWDGDNYGDDDWIYSYYDVERDQFYHYDIGGDNKWRNEPAGGNAQSMSWPEVLERFSVAHFARYYKAEAIGGSWGTYYNDMYTWVPAWQKNQRTRDICKAARDEGVIVYTIGMDTYGEGDAVLSDCAGTAANFYDIEALQIAEAFSSIARQISALRLTQ